MAKDKDTNSTDDKPVRNNSQLTLDRQQLEFEQPANQKKVKVVKSEKKQKKHTVTQRSPDKRDRYENQYDT